MTQRVLANGLDGYVDSIMLAHTFSSFAKGVLRPKIHYHPLQTVRVTAITYARTLAERTQFGATPSQPEQLLLQR